MKDPEGNQKEEVEDGQMGMMRGGRRLVRLSKVTSTYKKWKQKEIELDEEENLTMEDFEPQVDKESEDMEFEDNAYEMGEEDVEEDTDDKEE